MDYPVRVEHGKPYRAPDPARAPLMKKKTKPASAAAAVKRTRPAGKTSGAGRPARKPPPKPVRAPPAVATRSLVRRLKAQLAQAQAEIAQLREHAETDVMLGVYNRRGFLHELDRALAYIKRYHATGALVVLDVDRLKPINDAFGHAAGDAVLKAIAAALSAQVRASDVVGRIGGDEFAVLLWNLSATDAQAKAAGFEETIDALTFRFEGKAVRAGASAGVAVISASGDASRALEEADRAMYVRKARRRHEGC